MADTSIEWTDRVWNPTVGCQKVSAGCARCYAKTIHDNRHKAHLSGKAMPAQYTHPFEVLQLMPDRLRDPLTWRKPQRVFVNSVSDLFHKDVPDEFLDRVFAVMAIASRHTFQVLTKRPERMREYMTASGVEHRVARAIDCLEVEWAVAELQEQWRPLPDYPGYEVSNTGHVRGPRGEVLHPDVGEQGHCRVTVYRDGVRQRISLHRTVLTVFDRPPVEGEQGCHRNGDATCNAIPNLKWGTQEDNWEDRIRHGRYRSYSKLADGDVEEIKHLLACNHPATRLAKRFGVSDTQIRNIGRGDQWAVDGQLPWPLPSVWLGTSVENQAAADERIPHLLATPAAVRFLSCEPLLGPIRLNKHERGWLGSYECGLHWVIVGGESGPGARPMNIEWARAIVAQCRDAEVPVFVKQLGANPYLQTPDMHGPQYLYGLQDRKGGDPTEWPNDLQVREFPGVAK